MLKQRVQDIEKPLTENYNGNNNIVDVGDDDDDEDDGDDYNAVVVYVIAVRIILSTQYTKYLYTYKQRSFCFCNSLALIYYFNYVNKLNLELRWNILYIVCVYKSSIIL